MKKISVCAIGGFFLASTLPISYAQTGIEAMNLEISDNKTTNLVYPYPVISVDKGSRDVLAQKATAVENVLQIKASVPDFKETNLTVITADGKLYSYLLRYGEDPYQLNINYKGKDAEGAMTELSDGPNRSVLESTAKAIAIKNLSITGLNERCYGIDLSLEGIYIHRDIFYFQISLENSSEINFDTDQLRFFIRDDKRSKRTTVQEVEIVPIYTYGDPSKVPAGSTVPLVFAFSKFTIPHKKHLIIQLFEENGGRNLELKISNRLLVKATGNIQQ